MGLDIKTIRLCKTDYGEVDPDDYRILEEDEVMQFKNAGLSDKVFTRLETFYDLEGHLTNVVVPRSKMDDWECRSFFGPDELDDDVYYVFEYLPTGQRYEMRCSDLPTFDKQVSVVYYDEEVGYQRKGMNSQFYKDCGEDKLNYFVLDKATLEMYRDTYVDDGMKEHFQENIIDPFVEGETVAIFSW